MCIFGALHLTQKNNFINFFSFQNQGYLEQDNSDQLLSVRVGKVSNSVSNSNAKVQVSLTSEKYFSAGRKEEELFTVAKKRWN